MLKNQFLLNPNIVYLNHGAFGACPKPIFENYQNWQKTLEFEPIQFMLKHREEALLKSKQAFGKYVNCVPDDFFFIQNPTAAINQILRSLNLQAGDEVLTTNQEYGAIGKAFEFYSQKLGFVYKKQNITLPLLSKEQFIEEFWKGYNSNTKVISICHCTSVTGLIFPVNEICKKAKDLGLITIIDGAHVPGHIPLNLGQLDPDFYTGTLHKWLLSPKGCSFLYVNKKFQNQIEPAIISWGYKAEKPTKTPFLEENEMQGTREISAFLTVPTILNFFDENSMLEKQEECRKIILQQYPIFCDLLNTQPICKVSEDFLGQMCSIPISTKNPLHLKETLYTKYQIEIPIMQLGAANFLRISYQVYNNLNDLEYLKETLKKIKLKDADY